MDNYSKLAWIEVTTKGTLLHILELDDNFEGSLKTTNIGMLGNLFGSGNERTWKPMCELSNNRYVSVVVCDHITEKG
jgi:hypothetical protein